MKRFYWLFSLSLIVSLIIILQPCNPLKGIAQVSLTDINTRNDQFVDIDELISSVQEDIRYYTAYNFVGERIDGYNAPKCLLTKDAAEALAKVQAEMLRNAYTLKVYDCYRPQQAVNHFLRWLQDKADVKMKSFFYHNIDKQDLFRLGYIAERSGHSRGSTVDLTIVPVYAPPQEPYLPNEPFIDNSVDMGSPFDLFDPISNTYNAQITQTQLNNRLFIKETMLKYGFKDYALEWWHFTLENEPFPETFFNFPIELEVSE